MCQQKVLVHFLLQQLAQSRNSNREAGNLFVGASFKEVTNKNCHQCHTNNKSQCSRVPKWLHNELVLTQQRSCPDRNDTVLVTSADLDPPQLHTNGFPKVKRHCRGFRHERTSHGQKKSVPCSLSTSYHAPRMIILHAHPKHLSCFIVSLPSWRHLTCPKNIQTHKTAKNAQ